EEDGEVDVVDAISWKLLARTKTAARPRAVVFTPDGSRAFVSAEQGAAVDIIDARRHIRAGRVRIGGAGTKPMGLAMGADQLAADVEPEAQSLRLLPGARVSPEGIEDR